MTRCRGVSGTLCVTAQRCDDHRRAGDIRRSRGASAHPRSAGKKNGSSPVSGVAERAG